MGGNTYLYTIIAILSVVLVANVFMLGMQQGELSVLTAGVPANVKGSAEATVPPEEQPKVELFIMSECPYGLQMQKAFVPVMELLGPNMDAEIKWVSYLMHGESERDENTRQYCIQQENAEAYPAYLRCFLKGGSPTNCMQESGIAPSAVNSCMQDANGQFNIMGTWSDRDSWLSGRYAQYNVHKSENEQYGVRGSPTLVINGETVSVSRSAEEVKKAICATYANPPPECGQTLNTLQEAPGKGPVGVGGGAAAPAGNCG